MSIGSAGSMWKRSDTDGVPTWTTGSPRPATRASVVFRAGVADETPETRGWLAASRDLALAVRPPEGIRVRGVVKGLHTTFTVTAVNDQLAAGLDWLQGRLTRPDLDLLDRVLAVRAESAQQPSLFGQLLRREVGAQGFGMTGFPELGLQRFDPSALRWFLQVAFTTGNMALCYDGAPPDAVSISLPADERWSPPERLLMTRPRPAVTEVTGQEVGLLSPVPARGVGQVFGRVLAARTLRRIQVQRPGYEQVRSQTTRIDVARGAIMVAAVTDDAPAAFLVGSLEAALRDVVESGARPQELIDIVMETHRMVTDPNQHFAILCRSALDDLLGLRAMAPADLLDEVKQVTAIDVAELAATVRDRHLIGIPHAAALENPFGFPQDQPEYARARHDGQGAHPSICADHPGAAIYLMPRMLHLRLNEEQGIDIPTGNVVQLLAYPDGGRVVVTSDGFGHPIEPTLYQGGEELVRAIDSMVPADLRFVLPSRDHVPQPVAAAKDPAWKSVIARVLPWQSSPAVSAEIVAERVRQRGHDEPVAQRAR